MLYRPLDAKCRAILLEINSSMPTGVPVNKLFERLKLKITNKRIVRKHLNHLVEKKFVVQQNVLEKGSRWLVSKVAPEIYPVGTNVSESIEELGGLREKFKQSADERKIERLIQEEFIELMIDFRSTVWEIMIIYSNFGGDKKKLAFAIAEFLDQAEEGLKTITNAAKKEKNPENLVERTSGILRDLLRPAS